MSETISIAEFKKLDPNKIFTECINIKVSSVSLPIEGETEGRKWNRQQVEIMDETGKLKLGLFNGRVGKLMLGKHYLICDIGVDSYNGSVTGKVVPATSIREVNAPSKISNKSTQHVDSTEGQTSTQQTKNKIREAYAHIRLIEETLLEEDIEVYDDKLKTNLPKLGMVMKMVDNIIRDKANDL